MVWYPLLPLKKFLKRVCLPFKYNSAPHEQKNMKTFLLLNKNGVYLQASQQRRMILRGKKRVFEIVYRNLPAVLPEKTK